MPKKKSTQKTIIPPDPPEWLPEAAAQVWNRTVADLVEHGLFDPAFADPLANYCLGQGSIIDGAKRGEPPQAALLAQVRQLAVALFVDPESRRRALWLRRDE